MTKLEHAISDYFASTRHSAPIAQDHPANHARRLTLIRSGKFDQAIAIGSSGRRATTKRNPLSPENAD